MKEIEGKDKEQLMHKSHPYRYFATSISLQRLNMYESTNSTKEMG